MKYSKSVVLAAGIALVGLAGCTSVPGLATDASNIAATVVADGSAVVKDAGRVAGAAADGAANLASNLAHDFSVFWHNILAAVPH